MIISEENEVFVNRVDKNDPKSKEIVSINFAFTNFATYKVLFEIEELMQKGQRLRTK